MTIAPASSASPVCRVDSLCAKTQRCDIVDEKGPVSLDHGLLAHHSRLCKTFNVLQSQSLCKVLPSHPVSWPSSAAGSACCHTSANIIRETLSLPLSAVPVRTRHVRCAAPEERFVVRDDPSKELPPTFLNGRQELASRIDPA
jgi:hypothetical protein